MVVSQAEPVQTQVVTRNAVGLFSQHNILSLPKGALARAENCVIDREGVLGNRRGFQRYGQALTAPATNLMFYLNRLILLDGTTLKYDSNDAGTWSSWIGTFAQPTKSNRIKFLEANGNLYFTTERGVFKNDSLTGTPTRAGITQGLDVEPTLVGTGAGFFPVNTQIGYRVVFGREDANGNLLLGSPSFRSVITNIVTAITLSYSNPTVTVTHTAHGYATGDKIEIYDLSDAGFGNSQHTITVLTVDTYTYTDGLANPGTTATGKAGKKFNVSLDITIPIGLDLKAGDFWELYRTEASGSASVDPGDRHFKLVRKTISGSDLTTGSVTFVDTLDSSFLGVGLYTNDTEETLALANDRPPWAKFIVSYKDHVFYGNISREHRVEIQLLTVASFVAETTTITVAGYVYTASASENVATRKFKLFTTEAIDGLNVRKTMRSLCRMVNRDSNNTFVQAFYSSGFDDPPGKVLFVHKALNTPSFSVTSSRPNDFTPSLPLTSKNDAQTNLMARSKFQQPEAVPFTSVDEVGRQTQEINGLVGIRDSVVISTSNGFWLLSGQSDGGGGFNFLIDPLDPTMDITAPDTVVALDNSLFGFTPEGVVKALTGSTGIVSRQIQRELNRISKFGQFSAVAHACAYESEFKYLLATQEASGNSYPTIIWTYNHLTGAWTTWRKPVNAMVIIPVPRDVLYMAHAEDPYILKERKGLSENGDDFIDESITDTITATGASADGLYRTVNVTHTYSEPLAAGWLFQQGTISAKVTAVSALGGNSYKITLDSLPTVSVTTATLSIPISMVVEWMPEDADNSAVLKEFTVCQFKMEANQALTSRLGFLSDTQTAIEYTGNFILTATQGWGAQSWGGGPWGDEVAKKKSTPLRVFVPRHHKQCTSLRVIFEHSQAKEAVNILEMALDVRLVSTMTARRT